jgi:antitoxin HigA-1
MQRDRKDFPVRDFPPTHPGEILLEEFLKPMGISRYRLAKDISVPIMRISKICNRQCGISADTALRLSRYFGTSVEFWTGIQTHYDTERTRMDLGNRLEKEVKVLEGLA